MRTHASIFAATTTFAAVLGAAGCGDLQEASPSADSGSEGSSDDGGNPTTSVSAGFDDGSDGGGGDAEGDAGPACGIDADCGGDAPLCVGGVCSGCDAAPDPAAACVGLDPNTPVCAGGPCVQCDVENSAACVEDSPVCGSDNACAACTAHEQCATACALDTGHCIDSVLVVDGPGGTGFAEIGLAIAMVPPGERAAILVTATQECYLENIEIAGGRSIALFGADGARPCVTSWSEEPAITIGADSALYMQDMVVEGAWGVGIAARGARVFVDRSTIVNNQGGAVQLSQSSGLYARNSIFGGDRNNVPAIDADASDVDLTYSTIAGGFGSAMALRCKGYGLHAIRNSIVVAEAAGGEIDCPEATILNSALESAFGMGNRAVGPVDTAAWFVDFAGGDLHLDEQIPESLFGDVAQWKEGDPTIDIDGDPRPTEPGAADWCGADIP